MKKTLLALSVTLFAVIGAFAQTQVSTPSVTVTSQPLPKVESVTHSVTYPGSATYYYWVIANLPRGQSWPAHPFVVYQAPNVLNAALKVTLSWQPVAGALSYDVLKTVRPTQPATGSDCFCALVTGTASTVLVDQGQSTTSYTPNPASALDATMEVDSSGTIPQLIVGPQGVIASFRGGVDATTATMTAPIRLAASDPPTCDATKFEMYFNSSTSQLRVCIATNVWNTISGSGGGGGGGYSTVMSSGSALNQRAIINFAGNGISCADSVANNRTNCTVAATVSSVGLSVPGEFSVAGGPVTSSGTLTVSKATQPANSVWAGPEIGSADVPIFRSLVDADIPANLVRNSRTITAGTGLTGGGDLSANRTLSVTDNSTTQKVEVAGSGSLAGTRKRINFVPGANITITPADDAGNDKVDVTISASGTGYSAMKDNAVTSETELSVGGLTSLGTANQLVGSSGSAWQYFGLGSGLAVVSNSVIVDDSTIPSYLSGTTVPGSCTAVGQYFFDTDAAVGEKLYYCNGSTYEQVVGSGGGGGGSSSTKVAYSKQATAVTLTNGGWTTLASATVPAGTIGAGECLRVSGGFDPNGVAAKQYIVGYGGSSITLASGETSGSIGTYSVLVCNDPGSTTAQQFSMQYFSLGNFQPPIAPATGTTNSAADQTISFRAFCNCTDTVQPNYFLVEVVK